MNPKPYRRHRLHFVPDTWFTLFKIEKETPMPFKKLFLGLLFTFGVMTASFNLPELINFFGKAQLELLEESKASKWGKPWTPWD